MTQEIRQAYHFIGIGGIGMSGLAALLLDRGIAVTGSDIAQSAVTEALKARGASIAQGHDGRSVPRGATVVYSTAVSTDNPEFATAKSAGQELMHRSDLLALLARGHKTLAVAGSHGKTSTSALLSWTLRQAGKDSPFAVGGIVKNFGTNACGGAGEYFVAEADESDGSFLKLPSYGAIVTNLGNDHLDFYGDEERQAKAFLQFFSQVESAAHLLWCGDDKRLRALHPTGISYGLSKGCDAHLSRVRQEGWQVVFDVEWQGTTYKEIALAQVGTHQALNATAVFILALTLGVDERVIRGAFASFEGVKRRAEKKGEAQKILVVDDYAHHPTEVAATLTALRRAAGERRLFVLFQPHRYSRVHQCFDKYLSAFDAADELIVTDLYAAGEKAIEGVSSPALVAAISARERVKVSHCPWSELLSTTLAMAQPHDVIVTMGAGSITGLSAELVTALATGPKKKMTLGVIGGGASGEHSVSLKSAISVRDALDGDCYEVQEFGITTGGRWICGRGVLETLSAAAKGDSSRIAEEAASSLSPEVLQQLTFCDVVFPVLHGPYGEDGTVQGLFEILGKPYLGPDYRSCAISMDKAMTKKLAVWHGIKTSPFLDFSCIQWREERASVLESIESSLSFPLIVKPVHTGSSLGIRRADNREALIAAVDHAFLHDDHLLVEQIIHGRELEFAVIGTDIIYVAPPGEVLTGGKMYDYAAKYGANPMPTTAQAALPAAVVQEGIALARQVYLAVEGSGFARVDFFLDANGTYWLNEINPIPGFTEISLFAKIWEAQGVPFASLLDRLVIAALCRHRRRTRHLASSLVREP